jgi:hypothetical protein
MKYPILKGQTVEYYVLLSMESGMTNRWQICKNLHLQGAEYCEITGEQISGALQRLKGGGLVKIGRHRQEWELLHNMPMSEHTAGMLRRALARASIWRKGPQMAPVTKHPGAAPPGFSRT